MLATLATSALATSGCSGEAAAVIEVRADDLVIPTELSAFCLAAFDDDESGGEFGRVYQFDDVLTELPQTLTVEPGDAASAFVLARGYRGGVEVARDSAQLAFDGTQDVALSLSRCPVGGGASIEAIGGFSLGVPGKIATSVGRGGSLIVAIGAGVATRLRASDGSLSALAEGLPTPPAAIPSVLIAFDADGDCDDDLLIGEEGGGSRLWIRQGTSFVESTEAFTGASSSARAAAIADTDNDGDIDVVIGDATSLVLWQNDGAGRFTSAPGRIATDASSDITALAFVELDGDGLADLVVGRGREAPAPIRLLAGQQGGGLIQIDAAAPEVALSIDEMAVRDFDGDRVDDVVIAAASGLRVFAGRGDGRLEDRTFLYFPSGAPTTPDAVAIADWDGDCLADLVVSSADSTETFRGSESGFAVEGQASIGRVAEFADVDDDGDFDALLIDASGEVTWLRR